MNTHDQVLLAESGELPEVDREALEQRLAMDAELQAFQKATRRVTQAATAWLPDDGPSPDVLATIQTEARRRRRGQIIRFPAPWLRLAATAAAMLVIAVWVTFRSGTDVYSESARLAHTLALVEAVGGPALNHGSGDALDVLAQQLLSIQGFIGENDDDELEFMLLEEWPTAIRGHSTGVAPAGISG